MKINFMKLEVKKKNCPNNIRSKSLKCKWEKVAKNAQYVYKSFKKVKNFSLIAIFDKIFAHNTTRMTK